MRRTAAGTWARKRDVEIVAAVCTERDFRTGILCVFVFLLVGCLFVGCLFARIYL